MRYLLLTALIAFFPLRAQAETVSCTEGFTLEKTAQGHRLRGALETPTPGYAYVLSGEGESRVLTISSPQDEGMSVIQVEDEIRVDAEIAGLASGALTVRIQKDFNWGPDKISCAAGE